MALPINAVNPYEQGAPGYDRGRPAYPDSLARLIARGRVVDVGAGTGKLTSQLRDLGAEMVWAVEPSSEMRRQLSRLEGERLRVVAASAEDTGMPTGCADAVVFAQSWHWVDAQAAAAETTRLLAAGGSAWVLFNQLDVRVPWVKRLSRIMRSGDVHHLRPAPNLGEELPMAESGRCFWLEERTTDQVMELARTRSSYLGASEGVRVRMQGNLSWYFEHLGVDAGRPLALPYMTLWYRYRSQGSL